MSAFLSLVQGSAPLLISLPHTGTEIPDELAGDFVSPWLARKDADWWIERLYDFAETLGASVLRTAISRSVIDVNRDPSGASLYPGQATTGLCPSTSFDGEPLYRDGCAPDQAAIAARRVAYFEPYHAALAGELARLRAKYPIVVLYDCHSIRSEIPRLFPGTLPVFNIGTNAGASCAPDLAASIVAICAATGWPYVSNGRFKGGWITRHHARPDSGVHAVQMELACRGYMREPVGDMSANNWPSLYDPDFAAPMRAALTSILQSCLIFARSTGAIA